MHLTLMRHGEPVRVGGADRCDPELSDAGWKQAHSVVRYLPASDVDAVYSSPQLRARQTAQPISSALDAPIVLDDGLVEFDHGAPYVHYDDGAAPMWRSYLAGDLSPWGLTAETFHMRIAAAMQRLADRHAEGRVLAVCHGGVINAWTCQVLGARERIQIIEPDYASLHRYRYAAGRWHVLSLNEVPAPSSTYK